MQIYNDLFKISHLEKKKGLSQKNGISYYAPLVLFLFYSFIHNATPYASYHAPLVLLMILINYKTIFLAIYKNYQGLPFETALLFNLIIKFIIISYFSKHPI